MKIVTLFILLIWGFASVAQDIDSSLVIENIEIKANRISLPFKEESRSIEIITQKDISKMPSRDLAGILQFSAGIDIRQRGPNGVQADVGIRGGNFEQTLILINGIKMTDPQTGHHIMNIPLTPENIERIEIIKGPAARIYGQNAFSGAINIITKTSNEKSTNINFTAGQNQTLGLGIHSNFKPGIFGNHAFSISRNFSEGYRYNTDFDILNVFYQYQISLLKNQFEVIAGYSERRFGANGFYASPNFRDQYEEIQTSIIALQSNVVKKKWVHKNRIYWRRNQDEYIFVRDNPSLYRNLHIGNNLGIERHSTFQGKWGITGLGIELKNENFTSNNLGVRNRNVFSAYLEERININNFNLTPGISFHYYTDFGPRFFYGIDAGYYLGSGVNIFANAGTTYRIPSYTDRFYEDPANLGNPDLQPEEAFTYEAGIRKVGSKATVQMSYFNRLGYNIIDWTRDTLVSQQWKPVNIAEVNMQGVESSIGINVPAYTGLKLIGYQKLNYTYIQSSVGSDDAKESRYALENLRHQFTYLGTFRILGFDNTFTYRYLDRVSLDDYQVIDLRIKKRIFKFDFKLDINNLMNVSYKETNLVEMPGRWIIFGMNYRLI